MHCITKNHPLCMFFEFVTCCVCVKYVSLTAVKVFGGKSALTWLHVFSWCTVPVNLDVCILHISSSNFVRVLNKLLLLSYCVLSAFVRWSFCLHLVCKEHLSWISQATEIHISDVKYKSEVSYELLMVVQWGNVPFHKTIWGSYKNSFLRMYL